MRAKSLAVLTGIGYVTELGNLSPVMLNGTIGPEPVKVASWVTATNSSGCLEALIRLNASSNYHFVPAWGRA